MITAIVPVRKGSQRVKNKNIKPFGGSSLLEIKIQRLLSLKKYGKIDEIIVTTDSEEMLEVASKYDVLTHKREDYYASSEATNSEFFENLGHIVDDGKWVMYSPVTAPLISFETYNDIISRFNKNPTNVVTVSPVKHHMWKDGKPLNYDVRKSPNSQDLPNIYSINYGISIIKKEDMIEYKNVVTENPTFIVLDEIESVDIDTELDFEFAEFLYNKLYNND